MNSLAWEVFDTKTNKNDESLDREDDHVKQWNGVEFASAALDEPLSIEDFLDVEHDITDLGMIEAIQRLFDLVHVVVEDETRGETVTMRYSQVNLFNCCLTHLTPLG